MAQLLPGSLAPWLSGEFVSLNAGKSEHSVGVPQAAVNNTQPKHNALADPLTIKTTIGEIPVLRFMRHSLLARSAPQP
jgi:hypothetical protein